MSVVLRPLSTSELLDRTFFLYRNNFLVFAGIATIPELPVLALRLGNSWIRAAHMPVGRLTAIIVILVANYLALAISHAGTVIAVSDLHLEKVVTIRSAYATARRSLLRVIWISFVVTVAIPFLVGAPAAFLVAMLLAPLGMGSVRGFPIASLILVVAFFGSGCYWWLARAFVVPVTILEKTRLREHGSQSGTDRRQALADLRDLPAGCDAHMGSHGGVSATCGYNRWTAFRARPNDDECVVLGTPGGGILRWNMPSRAVADDCAHVGVLRRAGT